ncbi:helix-turn-helix transcriptional regulator [Rhizobium mesoamericanum]|uniref:Transcriptional regulator n=1 Tax=Rhizobium mesoamericanum STM3625 TaxID=1211777 RepID=K0PHL7_9HYPH
MILPIRIMRSKGGPLFAYVTPARDAARDIFSNCQAFVILVDPAERKVPPLEVLQQLFPLTPTEARLAHWLGRGRNLHDLAAIWGFSCETGRNHLKNIYPPMWWR